MAAGAIAAAGYYVIEELKPVPSSGEQVVFTIPEGASSSGIAHILENNGIIRNAALFSYYLKYKGLGTGFQAGTYAMEPGISVQEVIDRLNRGDTVKEETIRFTIPEGYTVVQTVRLLAELGFSEEELNRLVNEPASLASGEETGLEALISEIPDSDQIRFKLEGYLFPETYELPKDATAEQALRRMVSELERKLTKLPESWRQQLEANGTSFHDMLTIASLVEREVVVEEERALVSGVIYNRLEQGMPLQLDATVQYLFDEQKERVLEKDLQIESPYNTYLHQGLPPGPIASPGFASIEAALYPKSSNYLFYVTAKDGSGKHFFAETYQGHLQNIQKSNHQE